MISISSLHILWGICACFVLIKVYFNRAYKYWAERGVPELATPSTPFGTQPNPFFHKEYVGFHIKAMYDAGKARKLRHGGLYTFTNPEYVPIDLYLLKCVLQKNFDHFVDRGFYYNERDDPLSANLFAIGGEKWRFLRTKLSPAFTSGKLKLMFNGFLECAQQMVEALENRRTLDMKEIAECFTIDVIGSCIFGIECNSFKNPEGEFRMQGKKIFTISNYQLLKINVAFAYPSFGRRFGLRLFESATTEFFTNVVKESIEYRRKHNIVRKDFLQLLLDLQNDTEAVSFEQLTAQVFIFFAAGYETSSITLTFCLYELAINPEIQDRLRDEINQTLRKNDDKFTYESIVEMKYMNQVVEETLRKYPPVTLISRVCVKEFHVPGTDTVLEKGTDVLIPILGLHRDPDYYPEPDTFDPERFSEKNRQGRDPMSYIPFGEGPRMCIGVRFGLMQVKVGLAALLRRYKFTLNNKTSSPLDIMAFSFTMVPENEVLLDNERC